MGAVLIYLPCWPFSLQSFLLFLPKIRGEGPGPRAPSLDQEKMVSCLDPPLNLVVLKFLLIFSAEGWGNKTKEIIHSSLTCNLDVISVVSGAPGCLYSPESRRQVRILTHRNWPIIENILLKFFAVWL